MNDREASLWESILYDCAGETAAQATTEALTRRGFRVVRSFDLRSAMAAHAECECPHHGTAKCTCEFVVLLVYRERPLGQSPRDGESGAPVVVTTHSRDAQAQVQIVHDANSQPDPRLVEQVTAALFEAALSLQASSGRPAQVPADARREA